MGTQEGHRFPCRDLAPRFWPGNAGYCLLSTKESGYQVVISSGVRIGEADPGTLQLRLRLLGDIREPLEREDRAALLSRQTRSIHDHPHPAQALDSLA